MPTPSVLTSNSDVRCRRLNVAVLDLLDGVEDGLVDLLERRAS